MQKETVGIIFNGPPGSGKDTACEYLHRAYQARHLSFKQELYRIAAIVAGIYPDELTFLSTGRSTKEVPNELFILGGKPVSPRAWLIHVSETVVKTFIGTDYFGKQAASRVQPGVNVFSDGGFAEEALCINNVCDRLIVVTLHKDGCTFEGDSRRYFDQDFLLRHDIDWVPIENNSSIEELYEELDKLMCFVI